MIKWYALRQRALLVSALIMLLSACCNKNLSVEEGHEGVSYYVCSYCTRPYSTYECDGIVVDILEEIEKED